MKMEFGGGGGEGAPKCNPGVHVHCLDDRTREPENHRNEKH